jgi:diguanylate cyclase
MAGETLQELTRLLCRGLSRLAVAAQGSDDRLDTYLAELRYILRGDMSDLKQMASVIDAIDERIKQVDREQGGRADQLQQALELLLRQLQAMNPPRAVARRLERLDTQLQGGPLSDAGGFLNELARAQGELLSALGPRSSLWRRLFGNGNGNGNGKATEPIANETAGAAISIATPYPSISDSSPADAAALDAAAVSLAEEPVLEPTGAAELPFSHVNAAVAQVLGDLLRQIEAPPGLESLLAELTVRIGSGLNWYELVPTLEQVSVVVLTLLEQERGQFQSFLLGMNQKLAELHQVLALSRQHHEGRAADETQFDSALRGEVAAIGERIVQAVDLDLLKSEINSRLEAIIGAMDRRQQSERLRDAAMQEQLQRLAARVRDMEVSAEEVGRHLAEQRRLALLDSLTQLPNRRAYEERIRQEYERWQRYGRPLALALCDVDNFKVINDSFGHLAGDKVLRIVARTMRNRLRKADFMARYGGEEFAILMPETTAEEALAAIEEIRIAIAESPFHFRNQPVPITLSAGISALQRGDERDDLFERADAALYSAKQNGRNRTEMKLAEPSPPAAS